MAYSPYSFGSANPFQTQMDVQRDSFGNPINPMNMNPGWGMDPNLLTPSYDAPYRPQYSGAQPYNQFGRVGFFGGVNQLYNPFVRNPIWGNPIDQSQPAIEGVSGRPFDAAAWAGQRIAAPALAFGLAYRALGPNTGSALKDIGGYFTGKGLAGGIGRVIGAGFGRAFGASVGGAVAGPFGAIAGGVAGGFAGGVAGSLIGSVAIPYGVASSALWAGQKALWNPYINTRKESEDLRKNFAGVTFGDSEGNVVSGRGLSYLESSSMAEDITRQGIRDMAFSTSQYANIADLSARAGLMDNVQSKQITKRVKDVAEQIKLIMAISKDPDIRNAIEELSKLNLAGASLTGGSTSTAAQAYRGLSRFASEAGVSIQRLMNTAGAQGQYLFQSNGMTPYLGQLAAGNVYSGFMAAQRVGLMSPAQLARMGGVEGATQAALTGQMAATMTPYNMMAMYNQYITGRGGSAVNSANMNPMSVIANFGGNMARDPWGTMGGMELYQAQMAGKQITDMGSEAVQNQVISLMKMAGVSRNKNGKYDAEKVLPFLESTGMSRDQAIGILHQMMTDQDPRLAAQRIKANDASTAEQVRSIISQDKAYSGVLGSAMDVYKAGQSVVEGAADTLVFPVTRAAGFMGDTVQKFTDWLGFGQTLSSGLKVSDYSTLFAKNKDQKPASFKLIDTGNATTIDAMTGSTFSSLSNNQIRVTDKINALAKAGNAEAVAYLSQTDPEKKKSALFNLMSKNKDEFGSAGAEIMNSDHREKFDSFYDAIKGLQTQSYTPDSGRSTPSRVENAFQGALGDAKIGMADSLQGIGAAYDVEKHLLNGENIDDLLKDKRYAVLAKELHGRTGAEAQKYVQDVVKLGAQNGALGLSNQAFTSGATVESYKNGGWKNIKDDKIKQQFQDAMKRGDDAGMQKAAFEDQAQQHGGVLDMGIKDAVGKDASEVMKIYAPIEEGNKRNKQIMDLVKSGKVDFTTAQNTINTLDQKDTVQKFSDAVDKFAGAVDGHKPNDSGSNGSGSGWFSGFWRSDNDRQKTSGPTGANTTQPNS